MVHSPADVSAATAVARAARLRRAAASLRLHAGALTYRPPSSRQVRLAPAMLAAVAEVEQVVTEVQREAEQRARALSAASETPDLRTDRLQRHHAETDHMIQLVLTGLAALRGALREDGGLSRATIDAPYGRSAASTAHPGALCTIVAERVEGLARALELGAIATANLGRARGRAGANALR